MGPHETVVMIRYEAAELRKHGDAGGRPRVELSVPTRHNTSGAVTEQTNHLPRMGISAEACYAASAALDAIAEMVEAALEIATQGGP